MFILSNADNQKVTLVNVTRGYPPLGASTQNIEIHSVVFFIVLLVFFCSESAENIHEQGSALVAVQVSSAGRKL